MNVSFQVGFFPQLMLIRPNSRAKPDPTRLDGILYDAAVRGVNIHIIIYQEPPTFYQNSKEVMQYLSKLHPNITILRNPGYLLNISFWSFHEKTCIIDRKIGFLGGLDMCLGGGIASPSYQGYRGNKHLQ